VSPAVGTSQESAAFLDQPATTFKFIDQTDGDIKQRFWIFGDGSENLVVENPNEHEASHVYEKPGVYEPSLLVVFANESLKRIFLTQKVIVQ
jgi:PKD repeat protein